MNSMKLLFIIKWAAFTTLGLQVLTLNLTGETKLWIIWFLYVWFLKWFADTLVTPAGQISVNAAKTWSKPSICKASVMFHWREAIIY